MLASLWVADRGRDPVSLRQALRRLPEVIRLLRWLAADPALPCGVRVRLGLLVYLLLPIDLVPYVGPVIGYLDDAVVVVFALRAVVRWPGAGLARGPGWPRCTAGQRPPNRPNRCHCRVAPIIVSRVSGRGGGDASGA